MAVEVHHQSLGFPRVDQKVVLLAPVHKVLSPLFVLGVILACNEPHNVRVLRELLKVVVWEYSRIESRMQQKH